MVGVRCLVDRSVFYTILCCCLCVLLVLESDSCDEVVSDCVVVVPLFVLELC